MSISTRQPGQAAPRPKPTAHDYGVEGARRRWGPHGRILRLDKLDPTTKAFVIALLDAAAAKAEADAQGCPS